MKSGFIYLWYDNLRKKYYLGSHLGHPNDGYVGSNNHLLKAYKKRPENFKRRILESHQNTNSKELLAREQLWLNLIKPEELQNKYYNQKKVAAGGDIVSFLTEEQKQQHAKKSGLASKKFWNNITKEELHKRKINAFGGNNFSRDYLKDPARRKKMSERMSGENNPFYNKKHSEETLRAISSKLKNKVPWIKGKKHTEETKRMVKMNNPNRKTFYTPDGVFLSGEDYSKITKKLTSNGIRNILKERHKPLSKMRIDRCKLFSINDLGKTPFELGYRYENEVC